jgi:hypothetical protein
MVLGLVPIVFVVDNHVNEAVKQQELAFAQGFCKAGRQPNLISISFVPSNRTMAMELSTILDDRRISNYR